MEVLQTFDMGDLFFVVVCLKQQKSVLTAFSKLTVALAPAPRF